MVLQRQDDLHDPRHTGRGSSPTRVEKPQRRPDRIEEQHRVAVGEGGEQEHAGAVGDQAVASCDRSAGLVDTVHAGTVNGAYHGQALRGEAERGDQIPPGWGER